MTQTNTRIEDLIRDEASSAILNTNVSEFEAYKTRRNREKRVDSVCQELDTIKHEMQEIKEILKTIVGRA